MRTTSQQLRNSASPTGAGRTEQILGVSHIYKVTSGETGGEMISIELTVPAGHGIPMHKHSREDESFYVVSGRVLIEGDDVMGPLAMDAGAFFFGPRENRHSFRNPGPDEAKLLVVAVPGNNLEAMFGELATLTAQGPTREKVNQPCPALRDNFRFGLYRNLDRHR